LRTWESDVKSTGAWPQGKSLWRKIRNLLKKRTDHSDVSRDPQYGLHNETYFHLLLQHEEARSARLGKVCLLMLFDITGLEDHIIREVASIALSVPREVDVKGWWRSGAEIGILFTEIDASSREAFIEAEKAIKEKIRERLSRELGSMMAERVAISSRMFRGPAWQGSTPGRRH
jgi:GGDEF domain-containing protein